jgi:signal transduction histidine kinase
MRTSFAGLPDRASDSAPSAFSAPVGETIRALATFLTLFSLLVGAAGVLAFRELNLIAVAHRFELGKDEAERIARVVAALGRADGTIDFTRIAEKQAVLSKIIRERILENPFVRHVEVRDRSGAPVLLVSAGSDAELPTPLSAMERSEGLPGGAEQIVTASIESDRTGSGEVRVVVAEESFRRQVAELRLKVFLAAVLGILVLLVGFVYVLLLIRKNRKLEQSRLAAERRSYVGLLASGLAHEIRNPLNAMNMNLQMLEEDFRASEATDAEEHRALLASTMSEINRLKRLVDNFLAYARPRVPHFEARNLNEVLGEVSRFLQADFQQSGVELELDLQPLLPDVEIDETQLKQALMNLLVNARQVLKSGGRVVLRSRASASGDVLVDVQDDGPGIPPDAREKIFEVFYSNRGGGTGLGLPIARQIVERHGGRIEVDSTEGRGTTFRIRLPRRHERPQAAPPAQVRA